MINYYELKFYYYIYEKDYVKVKKKKRNFSLNGNIKLVCRER